MSSSSFPSAPPVHRPSMQSQPVRNALQMRPAESRGGVTYVNQHSGARMSQPPRQSHAMEQPAIVSPRSSGFGASALHDERVLDIPAYLRRGNSHQE